jgi:glycogen synthase
MASPSPHQTSGGPREILERDRNALLFAPRDAAALATAIARLANDPALRHRLGTAAARDVRRHWLWPTVITNVQAIYTQAANTDVLQLAA